MLWVYRRNTEQCRIETHFDATTREYVIVLDKGLPNERWERFPDADTYRTRLRTLDHEMTANGWEDTGPPTPIRWQL